MTRPVLQEDGYPLLQRIGQSVEAADELMGGLVRLRLIVQLPLANRAGDDVEQFDIKCQNETPSTMSSKRRSRAGYAAEQFNGPSPEPAPGSLQRRRTGYDAVQAMILHHSMCMVRAGRLRRGQPLQQGVEQ